MRPVELRCDLFHISPRFRGAQIRSVAAAIGSRRGWRKKARARRSFEYLCRSRSEIAWPTQRFRSMAGNVEIADYFFHDRRVHHLLLQGTTQRHGVETQAVDVTRNARGKFGNARQGRGTEQRLSTMACYSQAMLNVLVGFFVRQGLQS